MQGQQNGAEETRRFGRPVYQHRKMKQELTSSSAGKRTRQERLLSNEVHDQELPSQASTRAAQSSKYNHLLINAKCLLLFMMYIHKVFNVLITICNH